jgi:hypothetical protein
MAVRVHELIRGRQTPRLYAVQQIRNLPYILYTYLP